MSLLFIPVQIGTFLLWNALAVPGRKGLVQLASQAGALLCLGGSFFASITTFGAQIGITWWLTMFCFALSIVGFLYWLVNRQSARLNVPPVKDDSAHRQVTGKWFLPAFNWLFKSILVTASAAVTCSAIAVVWPGDPRDGIAFAGLLFPVVVVGLFLLASTHPNKKNGLFWSLSPILPAMVVILRGYLA